MYRNEIYKAKRKKNTIKIKRDS